MSYNFKEALDELENLKILESKADDFLKLIISKLKEKCITRDKIAEMYFALSTHEYSENEFSISASCNTEKIDINHDENALYKIIQANNICDIIISDKGEAVGIFTMIHEDLEETNGFICENITSICKKIDPKLLLFIKITF